MAKRPNKRYWQDRFEQLENASHITAVEYASRLDTAYRQATKKVQNEISLWYARFALNNEISMTDARKLLTQGELEEFKWTVQEYIEKGEYQKVLRSN